MKGIFLETVRSHLRLGGQTVLALATPPMGPLPCLELVICGNNTKDPGFESHLANTDASLWSNTIPVSSDVADNPPAYPSSGIIWIDDSEADPDNWPAADTKTGWFHPFLSSPTPYHDKRWVVSDADPHSGTYHARYVNNAGTNQNSADLGIYRQGTCDIKFGIHRPYSARVEPGQSITLSYWMKIDNAGSAETAPAFDFYDEDWNGTGLAEGDGIFDPDSTYQFTTHTTVVPANSAYVQAYLDVRNMPAGATADVDDMVLEVEC